MEKITLGIEEIIKARMALDKLLNLSGIARKKVYWFDRNRQYLASIEKKWFNGPAQETFNRFAIDIPQKPFISPLQYNNFKKELLDMIHSPESIPLDEFEKIFIKYEIIPNKVQKGIPLEKQTEYQEETAKVAENYRKEIEYAEIETDDQLDNIFKALTGEEQLAIAFMLKEKSPLQIFSQEIE